MKGFSIANSGFHASCMHGKGCRPRRGWRDLQKPITVQTITTAKPMVTRDKRHIWAYGDFEKKIWWGTSRLAIDRNGKYCARALYRPTGYYRRGTNPKLVLNDSVLNEHVAVMITQMWSYYFCSAYPTACLCCLTNAPRSNTGDVCVLFWLPYKAHKQTNCVIGILFGIT
jgi:hypothetical protein